MVHQRRHPTINTRSTDALCEGTWVLRQPAGVSSGAWSGRYWSCRNRGLPLLGRWHETTAGQAVCGERRERERQVERRASCRGRARDLCRRPPDVRRARARCPLYCYKEPIPRKEISVWSQGMSVERRTSWRRRIFTPISWKSAAQAAHQRPYQAPASWTGGGGQGAANLSAARGTRRSLPGRTWPSRPRSLLATGLGHDLAPYPHSNGRPQGRIMPQDDTHLILLRLADHRILHLLVVPPAMSQGQGGGGPAGGSHTRIRTVRPLPSHHRHRFTGSRRCGSLDRRRCEAVARRSQGNPATHAHLAVAYVMLYGAGWTQRWRIPPGGEQHVRDEISALADPKQVNSPSSIRAAMPSRHWSSTGVRWPLPPFSTPNRIRPTRAPLVNTPDRPLHPRPSPLSPERSAVPQMPCWHNC